MTARETTLLEKMRDELHSYHGEVMKLSASYDSTKKDVELLMLDMHGNPLDRENNPGALSHIEDLRKSRRTMRLGLRGLWVIVTLVVGAIVSKLLGS